MKANDLKGMSVISVADGANLGKVEDVYFDPDQLAVAALAVSIDGKRSTVLFESLRSVGQDAVTIPDMDVFESAATKGSLAHLMNFGDFHALNAVDEAGTKLGNVKECQVDPANGSILSIDVHRGGVLGIGGTTTTIAPDDVVSIGDVIVVKVQPGQTAEPAAEPAAE